MDSPHHWFTSHTGLALLESFAHSLWFGTLLTVILFFVLKRIPASAAHLRHNLLFGSQLGLLVFVLATWAMLEQRTLSQSPELPPGSITATAPVFAKSPPTNVDRANTSPDAATVTSRTLRTNSSATSRLPDLRQQIGLLWIGGASLILIWRIWQSVSTHLWATRGTTVSEGPWIQMLQEEADRLHYRTKVRLRSAIDLASPAVVGVLRPIILIPRELLTTTEAKMIRAILSHELAHLKRLDPLVVALQQIMEAILFFNPFVWILSRWSKREREAACDSTVAAGKVDTAEYGQILLSLAKRQGRRTATGLQVAEPSQPTQLKERIVRLLHPQKPVTRGFPLRLTLTSLVVGMAFVAMTQQATLYAAEALSHSQRINTIEKEASLLVDAFPEISKNATLRITTEVRQPNGEPIEATIVAGTVHTDLKQLSKGSGFNTEPTAERNWAFFLKEDQQGKVKLLESVKFQAFAPGFSPAESTIDKFPKSSSERMVTLALKPAITSTIEVVDPESKPIANARIHYKYQYGDTPYFSIPSTESLTTNDHGLVKWRAPADTPLILTVSADGYRDLEQKGVRFNANNHQQTFTLTPGLALTGRVIDRNTGLGIKDARIDYIVSEGKAFRSGSSWYSPVKLTQTDSNGEFSTHALVPEARHWLVARAPGYLTSFPGSADGRGIETFNDAFAAMPKKQNSVSFELIPQKSLQIEIIPPEGIATDQFKYRVRSLVTVKGSETSLSPWSEQVEILEEELTNDGHIRLTVVPQVEAPIEIRSYAPERIERTFLNWKNDDVLLADFSTPSAGENNETHIRLDFMLPEEATPPKGQVVIYWQKGERHFDSKAFPVEDRQVHAFLDKRLQGSPIQIYPLGLIGYYFPPFALDHPGNSIELQIDQLVPAGAIRLKLIGSDEKHTSLIQLLLDKSETNESSLKSNSSQPNIRYSASYMSIEVPSANRRFSRPVSPPLSYPFRYHPNQDSLLITPVPLNTPFTLIARSTRWVETESRTITSDQAIHDIEIEMPKGITFGGNIYDKDGAPEVGREITIYFHPTPREGLTAAGYGQRATTDEAGHFTFDGLDPDARGHFSLEIKTERGSKTLAGNVDIQKPFIFYLDRTYALQITVNAGGRSLKGTILDWANRFPGSSSGPQAGRAVLDATGKTTLQIKEPLLNLHLSLQKDGKTHQKMIPLQGFQREQFPRSIEFKLKE